MSLQHLAYANVRRKEVDISKITGPRVVQTRARTRRGLSDRAPTVTGLVEEVVGDNEDESLTMRVPNADGHDWAFSGHLKNQAFFDLIEHFWRWV